MRSLLVRWLVVFMVLAPVVAACAKAEESSHLSALDLEPPEGEEFNPDRIITIEELTDGTVEESLLKAFLTHRAVEKTRRNPYGRDSFLATYYSNGLSAVDALLNTAQQHRINPLVLLVRAQIEQGLVALDAYPIDDPSRVEYVFRCGCPGPSARCDPSMAGFDRQIDCLARQYRIILDDMEATGGRTSGGWQRGQESRTADGKFVTPADDGTAAAYQFEPKVGDKKSGNHLFWAIWRRYVQSANYAGPTGGPTGRWIGDACTNSEQCKGIGADAFCATSYPGGMCTIRCSGPCPIRDGAREAACIDTGGGAYCFGRCSRSAPAGCRGAVPEWQCCAASVYPPPPPPQTNTQDVCLPAQPGVQTCGGG